MLTNLVCTVLFTAMLSDHLQFSVLIIYELKQINWTTIPLEIIRKPAIFWWFHREWKLIDLLKFAYEIWKRSLSSWYESLNKKWIKYNSVINGNVLNLLKWELVQYNNSYILRLLNLFWQNNEWFNLINDPLWCSLHLLQNRMLFGAFFRYTGKIHLRVLISDKWRNSFVNKASKSQTIVLSYIPNFGGWNQK